VVLTGTYYNLAGFVVLEYDRPLKEAVINQTQFTGHVKLFGLPFNLVIDSAGAIVGNTVYFLTSLSPGGVGGNVVSYAASPPQIQSVDGVPADSFEGLPLTVVGS